MAKLELERRYLPKETFMQTNPIRAKIVGYVEQPNGKFTDKNLLIEYNGIEYKFTVWGDNVNRLIKTLGDDTEKWTNKQVSIMKQEVLNGGVVYVITAEKN